MRKLIATMVLAAALPLTAIAAEGDAPATNPIAAFMAQGLDASAAVDAAWAAYEAELKTQ